MKKITEKNRENGKKIKKKRKNEKNYKKTRKWNKNNENMKKMKFFLKKVENFEKKLRKIKGSNRIKFQRFLTNLERLKNKNKI